jgi:hypothetical protein
MSIIKIITGSIGALALASTIAATPAAAGGYYRHSGPDAGTVAGAAIAGMAMGAMVGAAANQPHYGYDDRPYGGYGYGYAPHDEDYYGGYGW